MYIVYYCIILYIFDDNNIAIVNCTSEPSKGLNCAMCLLQPSFQI